MTQQQLTLTRTIDAPVAQVWEVLTDLSSAANRLSGIESVQIMTSGPYAVGTRWRETRTFFGRAATEEMWVRSNDPLRSTVVEASSGGANYTSTWQLAPTGGRDIEQSVSSEGQGAAATELSLRFTATAPDGPVTKALSCVLGPIGLRAIRKAMVQDMDDIAAAAGSLSRQ